MSSRIERTFSMLTIMIIIIIVSWASHQVVSYTLHETDNIAAKHEQRMVESARTYKDQAEKEMRFKIFKKNHDLVEKFNRERGINHNHTYKLRLNKFADLTHEEFLASHTGYKMPPADHPHNNNKNNWFKNLNWSKMSFYDSIDWNARGAVTPVKDQGSCSE